MRKCLAGLLFSLVAGLVNAQIPSTDIFLFSIEEEGNSIVIKGGKKITDNPGYDNQPYFLKNGKSLLYTAETNGQMDIFRYDIKSGNKVYLTNTPTSEYSGTEMPGGSWFSVIMVEKDSSQRLWKFPLKGGKPELLLEKVKPVGYHGYINYTLAGLFVLGKPHSLYLANLETGKADSITGNIGRSFHKIPAMEQISFVHKVSEGNWVIKSLDKSGKITEICNTLPGREDLCWREDGIVLMNDGSKFYFIRPGKMKEWAEVKFDSDIRLKNISRIAVSRDGDRLAVVAQSE
jgi:Tol biopolymer transport system component